MAVYFAVPGTLAGYFCRGRDLGGLLRARWRRTRTRALSLALSLALSVELELALMLARALGAERRYARGGRRRRGHDCNVMRGNSSARARTRAACARQLTGRGSRSERARRPAMTTALPPRTRRFLLAAATAGLAGIAGMPSLAATTACLRRRPPPPSSSSPSSSTRLEVSVAGATVDTVAAAAQDDGDGAWAAAPAPSRSSLSSRRRPARRVVRHVVRRYALLPSSRSARVVVRRRGPLGPRRRLSRRGSRRSSTTTAGRAPPRRRRRRGWGSSSAPCATSRRRTSCSHSAAHAPQRGLRRWQTARRRRARRTASPTDQRDLIDGTFCVVRRSIRYHLFCIFALCVRGWASFLARGAVLRATHPNLASLRCVGVCLRVSRTTQVFTAAQLQVSLFARALGCSSLAGARVCGWASWASGGVSRAPRLASCGVCVGVGTPFARARFARWGEGPCDV